MYKAFKNWSTNPGETFVCEPFSRRSHIRGMITLHHRLPRANNRYEYKFLSGIAALSALILGRLAREAEFGRCVGVKTRKLAEPRKGIMQRDLGMSEQKALLALQRRNQQKNPRMKEIAQAIILSAELKNSAVQTE
jgi:hypothetical protein